MGPRPESNKLPSGYVRMVSWYKQFTMPKRFSIAGKFRINLEC